LRPNGRWIGLPSEAPKGRLVSIHVVTVGVSILTNAMRSNVIPAMDLNGDPAFSEIAERAAVRDDLVGYVASDPWAASAELNAMRPFLEAGDVGEVHLVTTTTAACALVSEVLMRVLRERFGVTVSGRAQPVEGIRDDEERFAESLRRLYDGLIAYIRSRQREGEQVVINATGGLKPELAVCLVVGNLTGVPVYYRHEYARSTIVLPTLVWPLCPPEVRASLSALGREPLSGPAAATFYDQRQGSILERLRLVRVERDEAGTIFRVSLAPYGRLLLDMGADFAGIGAPG
jgi:putative CRISPR-associated protein (TIGR02619 family)